MMMALLTLKSRLKGFYEKHYRILRCFGKAVLMIITLMIITSQLNYQASCQSLDCASSCRDLCGYTGCGIASVCFPRDGN